MLSHTNSVSSLAHCETPSCETGKVIAYEVILEMMNKLIIDKEYKDNQSLPVRENILNLLLSSDRSSEFTRCIRLFPHISEKYVFDAFTQRNSKNVIQKSKI